MENTEENAEANTDCRPQTPSSETSFQDDSSDLSSRSSTVNERRNKLDARLKNHKQEKLKRKLSPDTQLLTIAQEEFKMKKKLLEKLDNFDKGCIRKHEKSVVK